MFIKTNIPYMLPTFFFTVCIVYLAESGDVSIINHFSLLHFRERLNVLCTLYGVTNTSVLQHFSSEIFVLFSVHLYDADVKK